MISVNSGLDATLVKAGLIDSLSPYAVNLGVFSTDIAADEVGPFTTISTVIPTLSTGSIKPVGGNYTDTSGTGSRVAVTLNRQFYAQTSFEQADVVKNGLENCLLTFGKQVATEYIQTIQEAAFQALTIANFPGYIGSASLSAFGYDNLVDGEMGLFNSGSHSPTVAAILDGRAFARVKKDTKTFSSNATSLGTDSLTNVFSISGFGNVIPSNRVTQPNIATTGSLIPHGVVIHPSALVVVSRPTVDNDPSAIFNDVIVAPEAGAYRMKMIYDGVNRDRYIVRATGFFEIAVAQSKAAVWLTTLD